MTVIEGERVVKRYVGSDAAGRMWTEVAAIRRTAAILPVPSVLDVDEARCLAAFTHMPGHHGQGLIDAGSGDAVLEAAGRTLRALHPDPETPAWTHGDYGPQNLLYDEATLSVTRVLDWEFARRGLPISDLAWAEWVVRMHHPYAVDSLAHLFRGWGAEPSWDSRQTAMVEACRRFLTRAETLGDARGARLWACRTDATAAWVQ